MSGRTAKGLERELRFRLTAFLYESGRLSAGQAGQLAGMPRLRFLVELGRRGRVVVNLAVEDLEDELRHEPPAAHGERGN